MKSGISAPLNGLTTRRRQAETPLGPVGRRPLDLRLARDLRAERGHRGALLLALDQLVDQRMLGGEDGVGHAEGGVGPRGEDAQGEPGAAGDGKVELRALAAADPVALHGHDPLGPAGQAIAPRQQFLGVGGDLEIPAVDLPGHDLGVAAPAAAVLDLLVGQHGLAGRAPVHRGALAVGEAPLQHPDEDELLPPVVLRIAGGRPRDPSRRRGPAAGAARACSRCSRASRWRDGRRARWPRSPRGARRRPTPWGGGR